MAKRGATDQITRDDGSDNEESEEPGTRDVPLAPVQGRKIRGLPKRSGGGGGGGGGAPSFVPTPAPEAPKSSFSGFSFTAPAPAPAPAASSSTSTSSTTSTPFSFGAPAPAAAGSTSNPFASVNFGSSSSTAAAPPAASSPFTFGAPKPAAPAPETEKTAETSAPAPKNAFAGFTFTAKPAEPSAPASTSTPKSNGFSFGQPAAPAPAPAPLAEKPSPKPIESSTASTSAPKPSLSSPPPAGEVSYYTAVRGLNTSILSFLTSTLESDAFVNLGDVLPGLAEQYTKHLDKAISKAGWQPEKKKTSSAPAPTPAPAPASKPTPAPISMPKAPAAPFAPTVGSFTLGKPSSATTTPVGTGFTPTIAAGSSSTSSPFTFGGFGAKPAEAAKPKDTPKKQPSAEVAKLVEDVVSGKSDEEGEKKDANATPASKPFTFGIESSTSTSTTPASSEKKAGGLFQFAPSGPINPPTPDSKSFAPSANLESASASTPPAKLGKFGPGGSQPQLSFGGAGGTPGTPQSAKAGFAFGSGGSSTSGGFSIGSGAPFSSQVKAASTTPSFGFGASSSTTEAKKDGEEKPATPAFSFGSTSTSTTDKPAFSFGSGGASSTFSFGSTSTAPKPASTFSFGSSSSTPTAPSFSFSNKPAPAAPAAEGEGEAPAQDGEAEAAPGSPSKNLGESGGAGEEGEDTLHQNRAKLFKLEEGKYENVGLGTIKLKKETGGEKRRLLMRTDGNGNVLLNMSVTSGLSPTAEGKTVKFLGFDLAGKPAGYLLQVKTPALATEFADAVKKEAEAVGK